MKTKRRDLRKGYEQHGWSFIYESKDVIEEGTPHHEEEFVAQVRGNELAALLEAAPFMLETLEWISEQSNLFFAECNQAEEITERCKKALILAKYGRLKETD